MKKNRFMRYLFLVAALMLAGGKWEAAAGDKKPETIVYAQAPLNIRAFDPAKVLSTDARSLGSNLYDTLVYYNPKEPTVYTPGLAERWEISDDLSEWTFYLRKGVKFTTGREMVAKDVMYSITRGIKNNFVNYPPLRIYFDPDTGFKIIDDYTVKMTLKVPFAGWLALLRTAQTGILDSEYHQTLKTKDDPTGSQALNKMSIGTGPFILKEWIKDNRVVYTKNPNYWGLQTGFRTPQYDRFIELNVPEPNNIKMMLDKGDVDWSGALTVDLAKAYDTDPKSKIRIEWKPVYIFTAILMNPKYPPLADPKVRQAIRYAIKYDEIVENIVSGVRLDRPIMKPLLGSEDRILYDYDLEKAKKLMAESSYPNGFDMTLTIGTGVGVGAEWRTLAVKEADDLSKIGIKVKIEQYDWSIMDQKLVAGDYQAEQIWIGAQFDDPDGARVRLLCHSKERVLKANGYKNEEIDGLVDAAARERDTRKRAALYIKLSEILAQDGPFAFIAQERKPWAFQKDIRGFDGNPNIARVNHAVIYRKK
jgi:peptide/nickel transport system substrate-binding protein